MLRPVIVVLVTLLAAGVAPAEIKVWTVDPALKADSAPASSKSPVVRIVAPLNGIGSGQVVVSGTADLAAAVTELTGPNGATIAADRVQVRYVKLEKGFLPLLDAPVAGQQVQPVWLTVSVPADAAAGDYTGTLTVAGQRVAVELSVMPWKCPAPRDWRNTVNLLQSRSPAATRCPCGPTATLSSWSEASLSWAARATTS